MIITIDGPAASGKSTVARALAKRLGFDYLDTGATYRTVTWKAIQEDTDFDDPDGLVDIAASADIGLESANDSLRVYCDGEDVTNEIRRPAVTQKVGHMADEPAVRRAMIQLQRRYARGRNIVTEGRDQGTEVFPDADRKFYLEASEQARAWRRQRDLADAGVRCDHDEVLHSIRWRDRQDRSRTMGGLRREADMIVIDSTDLSVAQVVDRMVQEIQESPPACREPERSTGTNKT